MESAFAIIILCATPIFLGLIGALGGFIGSTMSSKVLAELNPQLPKDFHSKIVKRGTVGFLIGFIVGGIPMGMGLASAAVVPFVDLSYQWALYVAVGFALIGVIGTAITGSALFSSE